MFDIETIKQNALIGFHEEILRNNRVKLERDAYHDSISQNFDHDQQSVSSNGSARRGK